MEDLIKRGRIIAFLEALINAESGTLELSRERVNQTEVILDFAEECEAVDAVPVAWLKEKLTGHPELSYSVTDAIQNVLDLWEVEHGRRID